MITRWFVKTISASTLLWRCFEGMFDTNLMIAPQNLYLIRSPFSLTVATGLCTRRPFPGALTHKVSVEVANQHKAGFKNLAYSNQQTLGLLEGQCPVSFLKECCTLTFSIMAGKCIC